LFKKKKKQKGVAKEEESQGDDEGSALDDEGNPGAPKKQRKIDFFLDRPVDGNFHITLAKNSAFSRHKDTVEWSGQDIISRFDPYKARLAVSKLNSIRVWPYGLHGIVKKARVVLKAFMNSQVVEHSMTCFVLGNTVVMSLDYYGAPQNIQDFTAAANTFFTLVFTIEMGLRIIAIGPAKWLADKMNYMDGTIVLLSLVELIFMSGSGALSALRAVRIFRVFRVLRVARLLRGLKSMVQIINVISRSISSFIYLAMLLMLFIFIYALLGMQVFGGNFHDPAVVGTVRYNFDSFNNAFITSFILLTTENWNQVMFYAYSGDTNKFVIAVYFVSCIFVGNWMLLNLFLAILLDSFTAVEEEDMMTPEKKEAIKKKMLEDLRLKEGEDFIEGMDEIQKEGFVIKTDKPKKKKKKKKSKEEKKKDGPPAPAVVNILEESQEVDLQELARRD
jgi:Ion transport protein